MLENKLSTACAGDDSTWRAADWHWDSRAFVAAPKDGLHTSVCCKKRKTASVTGLPETFTGSCGGCKAAELAPLKLLQQPDNSTGSSRSANDLLGSSLPKVIWLLLPCLNHSFDQVTALEPGSAHERPRLDLRSQLPNAFQQVWPSASVWLLVSHCC